MNWPCRKTKKNFKETKQCNSNPLIITATVGITALCDATEHWLFCVYSTKSKLLPGERYASLQCAVKCASMFCKRSRTLCESISASLHFNAIQMFVVFPSGAFGWRAALQQAEPTAAFNAMQMCVRDLQWECMSVGRVRGMGAGLTALHPSSCS